jgi:hypothetical protein
VLELDKDYIDIDDSDVDGNDDDEVDANVADISEEDNTCWEEYICYPSGEEVDTVLH